MAIVLKRNRLEIWRDVIFALFIRELKSSFNDKFGLAWAIVNPLSFVFAMSYMRTFFSGESTHNMPTFTFMAVGMLTVQLFTSTVISVAKSLQKNKALFAFRQVQPISAVLAASMFELNVKFFSIITMVIAISLLGIELKMDDPLLFIACQLLILLSACSIGLIFAMLTCYVKEMEKVLNVLMRPMLFVSGVFYSLQDIPKELWGYLQWNPVLHAIELSRQAMYNEFNAEGVGFDVLSSITLSLVFISLAYYHSHWKQAISR